MWHFSNTPKASTEPVLAKPGVKIVLPVFKTSKKLIGFTVLSYVMHTLSSGTSINSMIPDFYSTQEDDVYHLP